MTALVASGTAGGYASDGANVYYSDNNILKSIPVTGGTSVQLISVLAGSVSGFVLGPSSLYWADSSGGTGGSKIWRVEMSSSATLTVQKASGTVALGNLTQTYTGTPRVANATTSPAGLAVTFTYNGSTTAPTNAGTYTVVGTVSDANYTGTDPRTRSRLQGPPPR